MFTLSPTAIASAPPEPPSPVTVTMIGTGSRAISRRFLAIASPCPRSSASIPGYAEERGQGEAIARNLREMARLPVPIIVTVTGEGGSGGALAIAVGDKVNILENSFYSVISPEGCASIIWRDAAKAETAAAAMKITAKDLKELGIVDEIVPEPDGGAHTDHEAAARLLDEVLDRQLVALSNQPIRELLDARYEKFRKMGQFFDLANS